MERVEQLDSIDIDDYAKSLLFNQLSKVFNPDKIGKFQHEIQLIVDYFYFRLTIARDKNTPGNIIENIKYLKMDNK